MAKKTSSTAVTQHAAKPAIQGSTAVTEIPKDWIDDAGAGFEGADRDSYAIPFLTLLQSNSPQCKKSDGAYIEGAEEGAFLNTVSNEVYDGDEGVLLVPVTFRRVFVEWAPRETGGGFVKEHSVADAANIETEIREFEGGAKRVCRTDNGNIIADTRLHYCMQVEEETGTWAPIVLSFTSTQIKKSRNWMSAMSRMTVNTDRGPVTLPMFCHVYRVTSAAESNAKGSWMGFNLERHGDVKSAALYAACKTFREQVNAGAVKTQNPEVMGDVIDAETGEKF